MKPDRKPTQKKLYTLITAALLLLAVVVTGTMLTGGNAGNQTRYAYAAPVNQDSIESVKAFMSVYKVLMSPRCMNCHPSGDIPLQGEDSHLHTMSPQRGADGKGVFAMKCANCHQPENTPGLHTPPGNPNWHLPPADMRMVFQGRTPHQLAKQLTNPQQNGHKDMQKLLEHAHDDLVKAGWNPGEGRALPPITHEEFVKVWTTWLQKGAYAPAP